MLKIIFFGMQGVLSLLPLQALLEAGAEVKAIVIPADQTTVSPPRLIQPPRPAHTDLPILNPYLNYNIVHLAWEYNIPIWQIDSLSDPHTLALLADFRPNFIVVACFPYLFPSALLELPRLGCLNLHPSLLPAYRGPLPLFWQAYFGERQTGVTLHFLNQSLDTGDIVSQVTFDWPEGTSLGELEQRSGLAGAQLLVEAVRRLTQGETLPRQPQPQAGSSYFSFPTAEDFHIPTTWEARRAFNFIRAARADWPLVIAAGEHYFPVGQALDYEANLMLDQPYRFEGGEVWIQFRPGVLRIQ